MIDRRGLFHAVAARRWAMLPERLVAAAETFINCHEPPRAQGPANPGPNLEREGYYIADGVAVIELSGVMLKNVPMSYPDEAVSTLAARHALDRALADPAASSILLLIDSPGGEVAGTQELADAVYAARGRKPVHAHVSDLGASAAYWVAAQADNISANRVAMVGSIGAYAVLEDWSEAYAQAGVTVHLLTSGAHKGVGVEGVPISDEQLAPIQGEINALAAVFSEAIQRGRGLREAAVNALATGRVWLAPEALTLGLIDRIENSDEALDRASRSALSMAEGAAASSAASTGSPGRLASGAPSPEEGEKAMAFRLFGKHTSAEEAPSPQPAAAVAPPPPAEETVEAVAAVAPPPAAEETVEAVAVNDGQAGPIETAMRVLEARVEELTGRLAAAEAAFASARAEIAARDAVIKSAELLGSPEALTITPAEKAAVRRPDGSRDLVGEAAAAVKYRDTKKR